MTQLTRLFSFFVLFFIPLLAWSASQPLPPDKAFPLQVTQENKQLIISWDLPTGYYLYQDKIRVNFLSNSKIKGTGIVFPTPEQKRVNMGHVDKIYSGKTEIKIPLSSSEGLMNIDFKYQGCSMEGFCYPPVTKHLEVALSPADQKKDLSLLITSSKKQMVSEQDYATQLLLDQKLIYVILAFIGLGLLLAFTPCVLPMVPILSGIIVGHSKKDLTVTKAFFLSLSYVMGMALTYMIIGIIVALMGSRVQAQMQNPLVIIVFSGVFVVLAGSLFGFYEIKFPSSWQNRLIKWDRHFKRGNYSGVFLMGSFSSLIVSPCVSAPLVGVLTYIAQSGNVLLGALALLSLGMGMGIPLILVGISTGKLLPKTGVWMVSIQKIFGILMLGVAIWLISRVIPANVVILLWAALFIGSGIILGAFKTATSRWNRFLKIIGIMTFIYGIILASSMRLGNIDPLHPWQLITAQSDAHQNSSFQVITSMKDLDHQFAIAKREKRPVILDFHAAWCSDCQSIERNVFEDPDVQEVMKSSILLRADVTNNTVFDQAVMKRFQIIAPPGILFFDSDGKELSPNRIIGEVNKQGFLKTVTELCRSGENGRQFC